MVKRLTVRRPVRGGRIYLALGLAALASGGAITAAGATADPGSGLVAVYTLGNWLVSQPPPKALIS